MTKKLKIREYQSNDKSVLLGILTMNVSYYFTLNEIEDLEEYLEYRVEKYSNPKFQRKGVE